jgi:hypothetical protein
MRSVPKRISDFLVERQGRMYCDTCIQERLGLRWRQQVQLISATLAVTDLFQRETGRCCVCEEIKQVTWSIKPSLPSVSPRALMAKGKAEKTPSPH